MAQWPQYTYGDQNIWEVEVGTRILDRPTKGSSEDIILVTEVPTNATVFNGRDATDLDASAGVDFRLMKPSGYDGSWEVRGFFNQWDNFETRTGNLRTPFFTPAVLPVGSRPDTFDYGYDSDLFSLEFNFKKAVQPGLWLSCGPRYVSLRESIDVDANYINPFLPGFAFNLGTTNETRNYMPGFGIGLECRRPIIRDIFFVGGIKGSLLANFASTSTVSTGTLFLGNSISTTLFEDSLTHAAGLLELNARFHYDISPGNVSLYAGYEAFWMDGVAVAPAQLLQAFSPQSELSTSNTTFVHGLALGMMIRFGGPGSRSHYHGYTHPSHH